MADAIAAATSLLGLRPFRGGCTLNDGVVSNRRRGDGCRSSCAELLSKGIVMNSSPSKRGGGIERTRMLSIKSLAMGLTKESHYFRYKERLPWSWNYREDHNDTDRKPSIWPPNNKADNPSLHNPLLRQERMGSGWLGAIFEWEGVIIEGNPDLDNQAWIALAQEEGKSPPPTFTLKRVEGMKNEQAISEVLCWSRDPSQVRRLASRKEEIYQALQGEVYGLRSGSREFVDTLTSYGIPMALVSTRPKNILENAIGAIGIEGVFTVIVAAEDVHRGKPDPEMFIYAAQLLKFIPERCIVFGNSNQTVEAAHDARMKCVAVASKHPFYELAAADLVVRKLDELSVVDLKNLAAVESAEFEEPELEMEMEEQAEDDSYSSSSRTVGADDIFW